MTQPITLTPEQEDYRNTRLSVLATFQKARQDLLTFRSTPLPEPCSRGEHPWGLPVPGYPWQLQECPICGAERYI